MSNRQRVIIYADPQDYGLAARTAATVTQPDYVWPKDGVTFISFHKPGQQPWEGDSFGCRWNKTGVTIYGPDRASPLALSDGEARG